MASTQLGLYNEALRLLGERKLLDLSENREPRRVLDDIWNNDAVKYCLEQGQWNFAMRAVQIDASTTVTPNFGYRFAFDKPSDWVRTAGVSSDEFFNVPLTKMIEEVGFWFADIDPIFVRYISNSAEYGADMTRWPQTFAKYVAAFLAHEAAFGITSDKERKLEAKREMLMRLADARSKDAMSDPTAFPPQGSWTSSRHYGVAKRDRGNRNNLIG